MNGYVQIENKVNVFIKKRQELVEKKKTFASTNYGNDNARRDGDVSRIEEMDRRVKQMDIEVEQMLMAAEEDMSQTRSEMENKFGHGAGTARHTARTSVLQASTTAEAASKEALRLREEGADMATVQTAELKASAAFAQLKEFEKKIPTRSRKKSTKYDRSPPTPTRSYACQIRSKKTCSNEIQTGKIKN